MYLRIQAFDQIREMPAVPGYLKMKQMARQIFESAGQQRAKSLRPRQKPLELKKLLLRGPCFAGV